MQNLLSLLTKDEEKSIIHKEFPKGKIIFYEGDICTSIGIIVYGSINIISYSFSGKEIIYNSLKTGDIFGNNLVFSDEPHYRGNVICRSDCKIALIQKDKLTMLLKENTSFLEEYLKIQSNFGKTLNGRIKLLSFEKAIDRLEYYLHMHNNRITYKNVSELARQLNLERETLSRLLSRLEKDNKIRRDKHFIELIVRANNN